MNLSKKKTIAATLAVALLLATAVATSWLMRTRDEGNDEPSRDLLAEEKDQVELTAIVQGQVWLDLNRNGIQDKGENGFEDVLVELRSLSHDSVVDVAETGRDGEFQFVLDEDDFDVEPHGDEEFYIQVIAPDGFEHSLTSAVGVPELEDDKNLMSPSFNVVIGETYTVDTGLVPSCDASLGYIAFDGIKSVSAFEPGSVHIEWDPVTFKSYKDKNPLHCTKDLLLYDVYLAPSSFPYTSFTAEELLNEASNNHSLRRIETAAHFVVIDDLEPHDVLSVLVVAKAPGLVSVITKSKMVDVDDGMEYGDVDDNGAFVQSRDETENLRGTRHLHQEDHSEATSRQLQEAGVALINEVLYRRDKSSPDSAKRRRFIEIYRPDPFGLGGCRVENDDGSFRLDFGEAFENTYSPYYSIRHKPSLETEYLVWRRKRTIWVRDLDLKRIDCLAFICGEDETIIDFVAWGKDGDGPNGPLYNTAVDAGVWSDGTFVDSGSVNFGGGYVSPGLRKGDSIGRDKDSTDTDSIVDWSFPGGRDSRVPTPSAQNLDHFASPVINEVLFRPKTRSKRSYRRRIFVEIYRRDAIYNLKGCTIQNHDGSWRYDFNSDKFDSVEDPYFTIYHKSTLKKEIKLRRSKGILWMRTMPLDEVDAIALFCDGIMVDYVSWSNDGEGWTDKLHNSAVASGMWNGFDEHVETGDMRRGASIGRDANSRNTHSVVDWSYPGGADADRATPLARNDALVYTSCQEQEAQGIGSCKNFFGYKWDGKQCVGVSGCSCEGSECMALFESPQDCQNAYLLCICREQEAKGIGFCELFLGYRWNGEQCEGIGGCNCEGRDCDSLFTSQEECQETYSLCIPSSPTSSPTNSAMPTSAPVDVTVSLQVLDGKFEPLAGAPIELLNQSIDPVQFVTDEMGQTPFTNAISGDTITYKLEEFDAGKELRLGIVGEFVVENPPPPPEQEKEQRVLTSEVHTVSQPLAERVEIGPGQTWPTPPYYRFWEINVPLNGTLSGLAYIGMLVGREVGDALRYFDYSGDSSSFDRGLVICLPDPLVLPAGEQDLYVIMYDYQEEELYRDRSLSVANFGATGGDYSVTQVEQGDTTLPDGKTLLVFSGTVIPAGYHVLLWEPSPPVGERRAQAVSPVLHSFTSKRLLQIGEPTPNTAPPSTSPVYIPTQAPSASPIDSPSPLPSSSPSESPSESRSEAPSESPSEGPSKPPSAAPTVSPTASPTDSPTSGPCSGQTCEPPDPVFSDSWTCTPSALKPIEYQRDGICAGDGVKLGNSKCKQWHIALTDPVCDTKSGGSKSLTFTESVSITVKVSTGISGGGASIGVEVGTTVTFSTSLSTSTNLGPGDFDCGECGRLWGRSLICAQEWKNTADTEIIEYGFFWDTRTIYRCNRGRNLSTMCTRKMSEATKCSRPK